MATPLEQLDLMRNLQPNWDGYGADPTDPAVIELAKEFVRLLATLRPGDPYRDVFVSPSGRDIIQDFESGRDRIQVSSSVATSAAQLSITQQADGALVEVGGATALRAAGTDAVAASDSHHDAVLLAGIDASHVSAADFIFS